jgi:hypothetical protein
MGYWLIFMSLLCGGMQSAPPRLDSQLGVWLDMEVSHMSLACVCTAQSSVAGVCICAQPSAGIAAVCTAAVRVGL